MKILHRDHSHGNASVRVPCLHCGRMVILADAAIDLSGPAFKAYYHDLCAREAFKTHAIWESSEKEPLS